MAVTHEMKVRVRAAKGIPPFSGGRFVLRCSQKGYDPLEGTCLRQSRLLKQFLLLRWQCSLCSRIFARVGGKEWLSFWELQ